MMDDDADAMCAVGKARRGPVRLQTGEGYARGGRIAMDRVLGRGAAPQEAAPLAAGGGRGRVPGAGSVMAPPSAPMPPRRGR
jgi:hypothetical protein